ncbi:MAG: hypothetical protein ACYSUZ_05155 [Planctomycetota bacterium]
MRKLLFCLVLMCIVSVDAVAVINWDGGAPDDLWSNALNWDPNQVPTLSDDVGIFGYISGTNPDVEIDAVTTAQFFKKCTVGNNSTVTINGGSLLASVPADPNFAWEREINVAVGFSTGYGTLNVNGGTVQSFDLNIASSDGAAVGLVEMTDGVLDVADLSIASGAGNQGSHADAAAVVNITGGEVAVAQELVFGSAGTAVVNITDGVLSMSGDKTAQIQSFIDSGNIVFFADGSYVSDPAAIYTLAYDGIDTTTLTAYLYGGAEPVYSITEVINDPANAGFPNSLVIYGADDEVESPVTLASGYTWGGWAEPNDGSWPPPDPVYGSYPKIHIQTLNPGVTDEKILAFSQATRDTGSYVYTIFSEQGNKFYTQYVPNLDQGTVELDMETTGGTMDLRLIIRDADDDWYVSSVAAAGVWSGNPITEPIDVSTLAWGLVTDPNVVADMDDLSGPLGPGALEDNFDPFGGDDPNFARLTGGGLYLDNVSSPNEGNVRVRSITWTGYIEPVENALVSVDFTQQPAAATVYHIDPLQETPQQLSSNNFPVGGWAPEGDPNNVGWNWHTIFFNELWPGETRLSFHDRARTNGAYCYTIFSQIGTGTHTQYVPNMSLGTVAIKEVFAATGNTQDLRLIVRDGAGNWYLSNVAADDIGSDPEANLPPIDVGSLTWQAVDAAAQTNMNEMAADSGPGVLLSDPGAPTVTPDLSQVTGIGLYLEDVANSETGVIRIGEINVSGYVPPAAVSEVVQDLHNGSGTIFNSYTDTELTATNAVGGYPWGGWGTTSTTETWYGISLPAGNGLSFVMDNHLGAYAYTIFSSTGNGSPTEVVDELTSVRVLFQALADPTDFRLLIRNVTGQWYISSIPAELSGAVYDPTWNPAPVDVSNLTWYAIDPAVQDDMNAMDGGDGGPGAIVPGAVVDPTPLTNITGGGIVYDAGNTNTNTIVRIWEMSWNGLPTHCGDVGTVMPGDITGNCYADIDDLLAIAAGWITTYDLNTFADLANVWLSCTEPTDVNCGLYFP